TKPTTAVAHRGGKRLEAEGDDYRILAAWIEAGCPGPKAGEKTLDAIELSPAESIAAPGRTVRLVVTAKYGDGSTRDVTRWAKFTSTDETIATVDAGGLATVVGHGEGAVTAWFSSKIAVARIVSPFPHEIPAAVFSGAPRANLIDDLVLEQLEKLRLAPSPPCDDATFLRSTRSAACRPPRRCAPTWPTPPPASAAGWWSCCWPGRNSSTTGPTSGATCCS
ncbi:MAG: hypothetical protein EBZ59_10850, partial [Planctomycetia bacterium]|nr:hypothetical protein [Planctomycetia bacterium]